MMFYQKIFIKFRHFIYIEDHQFKYLIQQDHQFIYLIQNHICKRSHSTV